MQTNITANTTGRNAGIFSGAFLAAAAIAYLFWPAAMRSGIPADFYPTIFQNVALYRLTYILFVLSALCGVGLVIALAERIQTRRTLVLWASFLGLLGLGVMAVSFWSEQNASVQAADQYVYARGQYQGFGWITTKDAQGRFWINTFPGSPLAEAGAHPGDELLAVGDQAVTGLSAEEVVALFQAAPATISLRVETPGEAERLISVTRREVVYLDTATLAAVTAVGVHKLDPDYVLSFGLVGLYLMVINWLGRSTAGFAKALPWLGIVVGVFYWVFVAGWLFDLPVLVLVSSIAGFTLAPAWFIWTGIELGRTQSVS